MAVPVTHRNITWRVHEASKRIRENHERQRTIIHAQNRSHLKIEREVVASRINRMTPGVRDAQERPSQSIARPPGSHDVELVRTGSFPRR